MRHISLLACLLACQKQGLCGFLLEWRSKFREFLGELASRHHHDAALDCCIRNWFYARLCALSGA